MLKYIVCYTIPEEPIEGGVHKGILESITGKSRSEEYQPIYDKLNKVGERILTSTYIVEYDDNAEALLEYILNGLNDDIKSRIRFFISEISNNWADFPT